MQAAQIADIVIGICFLVSMAIGYYRGLIRTIASIAAMVASYLGAVLVASIGKKLLAEAVFLPLIKKQLSAGPFAQLAQSALLRSAEGMAYSLLFFVAFGILQFVLFRIVSMLKIVDEIPVLGKLNKLGGAVLGFLWVFVLCLLLGNVFFTYVPKELRKQWGFGKKAVQQTVLLEAFYPGERKNPKS